MSRYQRLLSPSTYCLVDIQPLLRWLGAIGSYILHSTLAYETMKEVRERSYDLLISNYAFHRMRRRIQDVYLIESFWPQEGLHHV